MSFLRLHVAATRASTQQPALLGRVARTLRPSGIVQPRGVRWLSQAVSAEEAAVADESAQDRSTDAGSPKAAIESPKTIRNRMLRSLKEKNYGQVLAEYDAMVQASIPPDLLALNCIVEAKAQAEGTVAAQQTMKVHAAPRACADPLHALYAYSLTCGCALASASACHTGACGERSNTAAEFEHLRGAREVVRSTSRRGWQQG